MKQIDARKIAENDKESRIFKTFNSLALGESMELIDDHDPAALREQFTSEHSKEYTWGYIEEGPDVWRVTITKTAGS